MDHGKPEKKKERPPESRPRQEMIGPRTPRMVGTVTRARCSNCGGVLTPGFDSNAQFECTQPIPERIARKDARNDCTFYQFRTTVEKDTAPTSYNSAPSAAASSAPARPTHARKAFDDLFKK